MASNIIRINPASKEIVMGFAKSYRVSLPTMLDRVIEDYRRRRLLEQANTAYEVLKKDPKQWEAYQREMQLWDQALSDGLRKKKKP
ncbi:MAG: hypothetical protein HYS56_03190 [Candidatus Omnitrophica bacterium]|nr:hypothetical protein [Candidatus Omnitrophota bacterium]